MKRVKKRSRVKPPPHRLPKKDPPVAPQLEKRERVVADIEARKYAQIIGDKVTERVRRFFVLDFLATQRNDHTKSLSERVTALEDEVGQLSRRCAEAVRCAEQWRRMVAVLLPPVDEAEAPPPPNDFGRGNY